jgi:hypothetical protein
VPRLVALLREPLDVALFLGTLRQELVERAVSLFLDLLLRLPQLPELALGGVEALPQPRHVVAQRAGFLSKRIETLMEPGNLSPQVLRLGPWHQVGALWFLWSMLPSGNRLRRTKR